MRAAGVPVDVYSKQPCHSDISTTQIYMGDPFARAARPDLRCNVTCAWLKARNAKIEPELANQTAAQSPHPTTVVGMKGKRLKSGRD
jgi:hypothetical protein